MVLRWYAARTKPMAEYVARDRLGAAGCEVFLPCVRTVRRRRGHKDAPLFPGYLFLHYDLDQMGWQLLNQVPQLVALVRFDGIVTAVPDDVIAELVKRVEAINRDGRLWTRFHVGDRVRVTLGPLESLAEVVLEAKSPPDRVRVLLQFMGRLVSVQVPCERLQPIEGSSHRERATRRTRGRGRWIRGFQPKAADTIWR